MNQLAHTSQPILAALLQYTLAVRMQFQQFVRGTTINADLPRKYLEVFAFQPVMFDRDPKPLGLIQPFDPRAFAEPPDAHVDFLDTSMADSSLVEQLIQARNLSWWSGQITGV